MRPVHVWVRIWDMNAPMPGVLISWRRGGDGWQGWVAYVVHSDTHPRLEPEVHLRWLDAAKLEKR